MKKTNRLSKTNVDKVNVVNVVNVLGEVLPNGTMLEAAYDPQKGIYLVVKEKDSHIQKKNEYKYNKTKYKPLADSNVKNYQTILPTEVDTSVYYSNLLGDIEDEINNNVDLQPNYTPIAARYVMMTWCYDKFQKIPYLRVIGPYGSGKSRFLDVMASLSYHSSLLGQGISQANIYRWLDRYPGTLILDEADFGKTIHTNLITQILNGGFERNGKVHRCSPGKSDYEPRAYRSFGPKILASRMSFVDDALESRFLTFSTHITTRENIPLYTPPNNEWPKMIELRNRLLNFRFENFSKIDPNQRVDGLEEYEPRLKEIIRPLSLILGETSISDNMKHFLDEENDNRIADRWDGHEGKVGQAILINNNNNHHPTVGEITREVNRSITNGYKLTDRKVGQIIKGLGIPKRRTNSGIVIEPREDQLKSLERRYGTSREGKDYM